MTLRPTLQDIARLTGFSKTTVSLSLRNEPRIPLSTRETVKKVAADIGYRPNPLLSQIAAHQWRRAAATRLPVAFITTDEPIVGTSDHGALAGAQVHAETMGYGLEHFRADSFRGPERLAEVLQNRGIQGVMVGQVTEAFCREFPWRHFTSIACNVGDARPPVHILMPNVVAATRRAVKLAEERGYRRIGMAVPDDSHAFVQFSIASAGLSFEAAAPESRQIPVLRFSRGEPEAVAQWVRQYEPDAVIGLEPSVHAYLAASGEATRPAPAFVCLMIEREPSEGVTVSGFRHEPDLLGRTALEFLEILLRTNKVGLPARQFVTLVDMAWQEGETLPARSVTPE